MHRISAPKYFRIRWGLQPLYGQQRGTVEVSSQPDTRAQDDALAVRGLDEDHMGILFSKQTQTYVNQALWAAFPQMEK